MTDTATATDTSRKTRYPDWYLIWYKFMYERAEDRVGRPAMPHERVLVLTERLIPAKFMELRVPHPDLLSALRTSFGTSKDASRVRLEAMRASGWIDFQGRNLKKVTLHEHPSFHENAASTPPSAKLVAPSEREIDPNKVISYLATNKCSTVRHGKRIAANPIKSLMGKFDLSYAGAKKALEKALEDESRLCECDNSTNLSRIEILQWSESESTATIDATLRKTIPPPAVAQGANAPSHVREIKVASTTPVEPAPSTVVYSRPPGRRSAQLMALAARMLNERLYDLLQVILPHQVTDPNGTRRVIGAAEIIYAEAPERCLTRQESLDAVTRMAAKPRQWFILPTGAEGDAILNKWIGPAEAKSTASPTPEKTSKQMETSIVPIDLSLLTAALAALEKLVSKKHLAETGKRCVFAPKGLLRNELGLRMSDNELVDRIFAELEALGCLVGRTRTSQNRKRPYTDWYVELLEPSMVEAKATTPKVKEPVDAPKAALQEPKAPQPKPSAPTPAAGHDQTKSDKADREASVSLALAEIDQLRRKFAEDSDALRVNFEARLAIIERQLRSLA